MEDRKINSGKVREIYDAGEDRLLIVTSDRISAFDVVMPTPVTGKGKVLNALTEFWFEYTGDIVNNHLITSDIKEFPEPFNKETSLAGRAMLVKKLKIFPFECIVRGYISGSAWKSYQKDGTVCGISLPAGLRESSKFETPLFTPSTKAESGHDENVSYAYMADRIGSDYAARLRDATLAVYSRCADYARERGIIIADTKFEFGIDENGEVVLADEVLTPDSSRFWPLSDYAEGRGQASFDKQYLRDWLTEKGYAGIEPPPELPSEVVDVTLGKYIDAYEKITGRKMVL